MQPALLSQSSTINGYRIIRKVETSIHNRLYTVHKVGVENPVYVLKIYATQEGYKQEKLVFQIPQVYADYFVEACDHAEYQGSIVQYTVAKYSPCDSLLTFAKMIRSFPIKAIKLCIHRLLSKLQIIHHVHKVPFRTLHASNIIVSKQIDMFIVGWSKLDKSVTQAELIYDCAEIMFYMITKGQPQEKGLGIKNQEKKRFLSQKFWDVSKTQSYTRFFPEQSDQLNELISFFKRITIFSNVEHLSIKNVLDDNFFNDMLTFDNVSSMLITQFEQTNAKIKNKQLKQMDVHIQRSITVNKLKNEDHRSSSQIEQLVMKTPLRVRVNKNHKYSFSREEIVSEAAENDIQNQYEIESLIKSLIQTKLYRSMSACQLLFNVDWIDLCSYNVNVELKSSNNFTLSYEIELEVRVFESFDILPVAQKIYVDLAVVLDECPRKANSCVKEYSIDIKQEMSEILANNIKDYLGNGLDSCFIFSEVQ